MKKIINSLFGLLILFAPLLALAAPGALTDPGDNTLIGTNLFSPPLSDKSVQYLSQIFGTVGGVIHGSSGQLLSEVFRVFNYAMVVIASFILIYTVVRSILDTAQDGEFMGKKTNSAWIIFRAVVGIGILVPKYTGYSLIQVFVLWITVQGIGLADKTWSMALNYLQNGGVIYDSPDDTLTNPAEHYNDYIFRDGIQKNLAVAQNILKSEVCLFKLQSLAEKERADALSRLAKDPSNPVLFWKSRVNSSYKPIWDDTAKTVSFGIPSDRSGANQVCGVYTWKDSRANFESYKKVGLTQMVTDLAPAAKSISDSTTQKSSQNSDETIRQEILVSVTAATVDYGNILQPVLREDDRHDDWKNVLERAKGKGWLMAGAYYWDLAAIQNDLNYDLQNYQPDGRAIADNLSSYGVDANAVSAAVDRITTLVTLDDLYNALTNYTDRTSIDTDELRALPEKDEMKLHDATGGGLAGRISGYISDPLSQALPFGHTLTMKDKTNLVYPIMAPLNKFFDIMNNLTKTWLLLMNDPSGDPIYKIQVLGNTMLDSALQLWISGALILGLMVGAVTVFSTVFNLGYAIEAALKLLVPVFVLLIGALFVSGYVFAVYIPLIPYLIFTFAAIGWLISVLEAVVAAPLVAAHITHPEGHDLLGKAEQAVILMMGVFLRPVVMIIGFLAAMVMSHVILRIINAGFGHVIMSSRVTSGDGEAVWLISIIGVIVIYTTTVVSLINLIYNAGIVKLWETIWMWVGFHQQAGAGAAVDHAMQEIRGAVQSTGKGFGDAGNEGFKGGVDAGAGLGRDAGNAASKVGSAGLDIGLAAYKGSNFKMKKGETQLSDTSAPHGKEEMGS